MSGPEPHVDSGEIRETANPEDIPPDPEIDPENEAASGEESEPEGTQTTGSFGQTFSS